MAPALVPLFFQCSFKAHPVGSKEKKSDLVSGNAQKYLHTKQSGRGGLDFNFERFFTKL